MVRLTNKLRITNKPLNPIFPDVSALYTASCRSANTSIKTTQVHGDYAAVLRYLAMPSASPGVGTDLDPVAMTTYRYQALTA